MVNKSNRLSSLLENNPHLDHLVRMLRSQQALLEEVRALLPGTLAQHCLHVRISGERLVIHVDSPAWASRLRFQANTLLQALRPRAPNLKKVSIRILLPLSAEKSQQNPSRRKRHSLAQSIDDEELKRLLKDRDA